MIGVMPSAGLATVAAVPAVMEEARTPASPGLTAPAEIEPAEEATLAVVELDVLATAVGVA